MVSTESVSSLDGLYAKDVNPQWVKLLHLLEMDARYERCAGAELQTSGGRRILDFLSGYCIDNTGHTHPAIIAALKDELDRSWPAMLQSHVPELAAELAFRLVQLVGGKPEQVFFTNSGSEGVETAIKFARAHTGRQGLLYAAGGFHGLTCGALSLMRDPFWCDGFGPMLPGTQAVRFGDVETLERQLASRKFAAFIVERQSEGGIQLPPPHYLRAARDLCDRYGTLLVLDEVQTGMHRTGEFLAAHHFHVQPDMVILAKAVSGRPGCCGRRAGERGGLQFGVQLAKARLRPRLHLRREQPRDARGSGHTGCAGARELRRTRRAVGRGSSPPARRRARAGRDGEGGSDLGMLTGIEFTTPRQLRLRVPMVVTESKIAEFVGAVRSVVAAAHVGSAFWSEALGMAKRTVDW